MRLSFCKYDKRKDLRLNMTFQRDYWRQQVCLVQENNPTLANCGRTWGTCGGSHWIHGAVAFLPSTTSVTDFDGKCDMPFSEQNERVDSPKALTRIRLH